MNLKLNKSIVAKLAHRQIHMFLITALLVLGCDSEGGSNGAKTDYLDSWISETPVEATMSVSVGDANGQSENVNVAGEMTVFLDFYDDGTLDLTFDFVSISPPACSSEQPCNVQSTPIDAYIHQYVGKRIAPEGLEASYVKIVSETNSEYANGYAYVSADRLCISHGLWDMLIVSDGSSASNPLAIDFARCFVRSLES